MRTLRIVLTVAVIALLVSVVPTRADPAAPWPTKAWATSTPEEQGMRSEELAEFFKTFSQPHFNFDSLLVIRHGYIVAEVHSAPNQSEVAHHLYSVSKSVVSALVGIAIDQG